MTVARVTDITSSSPKSCDDALRGGLARASKTLRSVTEPGSRIRSGAKNGTITKYHVRMKISFVLKD